MVNKHHVIKTCAFITSLVNADLCSVLIPDRTASEKGAFSAIGSQAGQYDRQSDLDGKSLGLPEIEF
jgi:hypothetical protein